MSITQPSFVKVNLYSKFATVFLSIDIFFAIYVLNMQSLAVLINPVYTVVLLVLKIMMFVVDFAKE